MPISPDKCKELCKRFDSLKSQRSNVEEVWEVIERYVAPYRGRFFRDGGGESSIEWKRRDLYDATAVQAHIQLASSIHGAATNPAIKWFELQWRSKEAQEDYTAQSWIETASARVYHELQDSNFNLEANLCYRNLTSFGTAFLIEEPKAEPTQAWQGIDFTHVPLKQAYFEPDEKGQCYNFYRALNWKASKLVSKFGINNVPEKVRTAYEAASDAEFLVVFCVYARPDKIGQTTARILTPENRPYGWCYLMHDDQTCIDEGGYYEMPAFVPRWEITDESMWGHSPAHYALADILTLNQLVQLDLKSREKVIDPAILANERALLADLDLGPGAVNAVRDINAFKAFESAARFDAVESTIVRLQMAIQRYFYIDQLELKESPAMTATEVQVRYELMQRLLSSTMARLKEDMLNPLVQRTLNMLIRANELPPMPDNVDTDYDVSYIGPLSRSMRFDQSASIERWINQLGMIAQLGGEAEKVMLVPDFDKIARHSARQLDLPTDLTRDKDKVEEDMVRIRGEQERMSNAEAAANEARAAKDVVQAEQLRGGVTNIAGQ
jgi:hypothetical protein